jgi:hypothetical protein
VSQSEGAPLAAAAGVCVGGGQGLGGGGECHDRRLESSEEGMGEDHNRALIEP